MSERNAVQRGFDRFGTEAGFEKKSGWAHIVARLEDLAPDVEQRIGELLDLEHEMPDAQREDELLALLTEHLLPLIGRGSSMVGLRSVLDDGTFAAAGIRAPAQQALDDVNQ